MSEGPIVVAIVEDDFNIRGLLKSAIHEDPGFVCEHTYDDGHEAVADFRLALPHVILMDFEMPKMNGLSCLREIRSFAPDVPILMLTVHDDDETVFSALTAGASGYMAKGVSTEELLDAIRDAVNGGAPMSSGIARKVVGYFRKDKESPLSDREQEVLRYLCDGDSYKEVAEKLFLSKHTIRRHIRSIYQKLDVSSRAEMVRRAHRDGLTY